LGIFFLEERGKKIGRHKTLTPQGVSGVRALSKALHPQVVTTT